MNTAPVKQQLLSLDEMKRKCQFDFLDVHARSINNVYISMDSCSLQQEQEAMCTAPRLVAQWQRQGFFASVTWVRASTWTSVIPVVFYLSTWLAGCSVGPGINCGARKLVQTPWISKKKKKEAMCTASLWLQIGTRRSAACVRRRETLMNY